MNVKLLLFAFFVIALLLPSVFASQTETCIESQSNSLGRVGEKVILTAKKNTATLIFSTRNAQIVTAQFDDSSRDIDDEDFEDIFG